MAVVNKEESNTNLAQGEPDEVFSTDVIAHIKIVDADTGQELVNKRG